MRVCSCLCICVCHLWVGDHRDQKSVSGSMELELQVDVTYPTQTLGIDFTRSLVRATRTLYCEGGEERAYVSFGSQFTHYK